MVRNIKKLKVLLIAPLMDLPTITSNMGVLDILDYASNRNDLDIDYLWGVMANRIAFNIATKLKKYDAIFYWGHGKEVKLHGTHFFWSVISKKNIYKAGNTPFDTMACLSAKELGKFAVATGTKAYIGTTELYYAAYPEKERDFLADWIDYTTIRQKALLDGKTFGEAYDMFVDKISAYIKLYEGFGDYRNYDWYAEAARHNRKHTILIGDRNARLGFVK